MTRDDEKRAFSFLLEVCLNFIIDVVVDEKLFDETFLRFDVLVEKPFLLIDERLAIDAAQSERISD